MSLRLSNRRRLGTWIGIYALFFQALVPFAQALPGPNGGALIICKVAGSGSSTQHAPVRGPGAIDGHGCVVCTAVTAPTAPTPLGTILSVPHASTVAAPTSAHGHETEQQLLTQGFLARAPPRA